jgi:Macrocin-O-methyltransferase (TylF)
MVGVLQPKNVTLTQLRESFGLVPELDHQFLREWQDNVPELEAEARVALEEVKADFLHLSRYDLLEPIVKMVVLSPILRLAGFYRDPFYVAAEKKVELLSEDGDLLVRGMVDLIVFHPKIWIVSVEAKRSYYSLEAAIPQALFYMLGQATEGQAVFGLVTNGREFQFLKLLKGEVSRYALSYTLSLNRDGDLVQVVRSLRSLAHLISAD